MTDTADHRDAAELAARRAEAAASLRVSPPITVGEEAPDEGALGEGAERGQLDSKRSDSGQSEPEQSESERLTRPARNTMLGAATAEGLSTMTPVTPMTGASDRPLGDVMLRIRDLSMRFGKVEAVNNISLDVRAGSVTGIVGPNGAGKTTTLSMATGLLRPSSGTVEVLGVDVWANPKEAHPAIGALPDRLRTFEQLTGSQLLYYTGMLRGLSRDEATARAAALIRAFGLQASADRLVADYSAGMSKKIALASALVHGPKVLVLDEPFETIDPVSAAELSQILLDFVGRGGSVILSSHSMDLVQRICDHVAIIVAGELLASGTVDEVRGDVTLEERFRDLARGPREEEGLDWLDISFS